MSKEMDALLAAVTEETKVAESVIALLAQLNAMLAEAQASNNLAAFQKIATDIQANNKAIADAVVANTPAKPAPTPPPLPAARAGA